jgi:hypothetical protein
MADSPTIPSSTADIALAVFKRYHELSLEEERRRQEQQIEQCPGR